MIIDSHAHLMDEMYSDDFDDVVSRCVSSGLEFIVNIGYSEKTSREALKMAKEFDFMYATIGLHPDECNGDTVNLEFIRELSKEKKVVAIGEIGLDYHYDGTNKINQEKHFVRQIQLANELSLPIVIHSRDADMDMIRILKENHIKQNFVMHCFSSSVEVLKEVLKLGGFVSLAGTVTFKNARNLLEVAKVVPEDKLLLETDAPYLTPEPYRGKRNEPSFIWKTAEKVAEIRGVTLEEVCQMTSQNAKKFYGV